MLVTGDITFYSQTYLLNCLLHIFVKIWNRKTVQKALFQACLSTSVRVRRSISLQIVYSCMLHTSLGAANASWCETGGWWSTVMWLCDVTVTCKCEWLLEWYSFRLKVCVSEVAIMADIQIYALKHRKRHCFHSMAPMSYKTVSTVLALLYIKSYLLNLLFQLYFQYH